MRIIAGRFRSRKLKSVPGLLVRPTPDRLRETLFSILMPRMEGSLFMDVYAGSGAVGIEALSRGAAHAVLVEKSAQAIAVIRENLQMLRAEGEASVVRGNAATVLPQILASRKPDLVFLDPPYDLVNEYGQTLKLLAEAACPFVMAQHHSKLVLAEDYQNLHRFRVVKQGENSLSFYSLSDASG